MPMRDQAQFNIILAIKDGRRHSRCSQMTVKLNSDVIFYKEKIYES